MPLKLAPDRDETILGVAFVLRSRRKSCVSVVEECLGRIDEWEPKVHAWVSVDRDGALDRARELDAELKAGKDRGALHGIPLGIKDLIDVAGWPTGAGSKLLSRQVVDRDATLVSRLREAGAIILGKTVTTQFACFDPPVTRNPWNLERTPGGSSSGSAAAVATGMCLAAIGSQTGGSITRPASFCGVCGCKPTFSSIPTGGVYPVAKSLDHPGPIARSVADLAVLMDALSNPTPNPLESTGAAFRMSNLLQRFSTSSHSAVPPRLSRVGGLFDERVEPAMRDAFTTALTGLAAAGAVVNEAELPDLFQDVLNHHRTLMLYELGQVHKHRFMQHPEDYLPGMRGLIEESRNLTPVLYHLAQQHQQSLRSEMAIPFLQDQADLLVCPATIGPAPDAATTGDPVFNAPWSYLGLPTVSFPIGLSPEGLPLAIQLVGRAGDETRLFQAALWCEQVVRNAS